MSRYEKGMRVGAILGTKAEEKLVELLGYGVYEGEEVPPNTGPRSFTGMLAEAGATNHKILLDDGTVVWGCECWWGPEEQIRQRIARWEAEGYSVVTRSIEELRSPPV